MKKKEFASLCQQVLTGNLSPAQEKELRERLESTNAIVLEIPCGRNTHELIAADPLAEILARVGVEESLHILQKWEGGQRHD